MRDHLTVEDFRPAQGEAFTVAAGDAGTLTLTLREARGLGRTFQDREAFVLTFAGPAEPYLPQATYRFTHERVGTHEIFIVPVGRDDDGYEYEANFV